jgi:hypothetical protein
MGTYDEPAEADSTALDARSEIATLNFVRAI